MNVKGWIKKSFVVSLLVIQNVPTVAKAYGEASVIQSFITKQSLVPLIKPSWGNFILHSDSLNKLYSLRGYQAIWTDLNGAPNEMAETLKVLLASADRHGLDPNDYWDVEVEKLYQAALKNPQNWITFELAATEALVRYATHLSTGRFDPEQVDTDIKFKKKAFTEFEALANIVSRGSEGLSSGMDFFAPSHSRYADLMQMLSELRALKKQGGWATINSPGVALKKGAKSPVIGQLRARFNQLGYSISTNGGNSFDQEFENVLKDFQANNGLTADGVIGTRSEVLRSLNFSVNQRISQVEVTMEKLRWLPKNLEQRHIFVNLATTEFRLFDEMGLIFKFKTVNGQPFRRTPSMRDLITFVNLNPYWTVPQSIAVKDKLPLLKSDARYLEKNNMLLIDVNSEQTVDPNMIDWQSMTARNFKFYIRQLPGPTNALGVVKFPLQNPWAIYLHDTNDRKLFGESKRHRSSGCVRLEQPLELAAYLLRDQAGWSFEEIQNFVPLRAGDQAVELDKKVTLKKSMPVYMIYLTAEKTEGGAMRFVEDVYGQDIRLSKALQNKKDSIEASAIASAQAKSLGSLQVLGEAGRFQIFQKVKAVRCDVQKRGACDAPIYFNLNTPQNVPAGSYLVGFENSLYPEMVKVEAGQMVSLNLEKVAVPAAVKGSRIRVYRDFTSLTEQKKIYLEMYMMNRHFFSLDASNFGALYLAGAWERDYVQRFTYDICGKLSSLNEVSASARTVCDAWNSAKGPMDLRALFNFGSDGSVQEMWVTYPGDTIPSKHSAYLVSAPMGEQDFVSVFPGAYRVQAEGKNMVSVPVKTGGLSQYGASFGISLNPSASLNSLSSQDCSNAQSWMTESRAYCTNDKQEGCNRAAAVSCAPM